MKETAKASAAFDEYCALGPTRSLAKLAKHLGQSEGEARVRLATLEVWSATHTWQDRVKVYDQQRAKERRLVREAAIEEMNARHIELAQQQQQIATGQIKALIAAKAFGSVASVQLLKISLDTERLAAGAATERTELNTPPDSEGAKARLIARLAALPDDDDDGRE